MKYTYLRDDVQCCSTCSRFIFCGCGEDCTVGTCSVGAEPFPTVETGKSCTSYVSGSPKIKNGKN